MCFFIYFTQLSVTFAVDSFVTFDDSGTATARFVLQVNGCTLVRGWGSACDKCMRSMIVKFSFLHSLLSSTASFCI